MQEALNDLETRLDKLFGKGSPYQMSDKSRKSLAGVVWVIVLIIGVIQAWSALMLWQLGHLVATQVVPGSNGIVEQTYPYLTTGTFTLNFFFFVSFGVALIDAGLLLLSVASLKDMGKHGWDLVYYSLLVNLVYSFLRIFSNVGGGFGGFVVQLFFSAVFAYFLFQIRGMFVVFKAKTPSSPHEHPDIAHGHTGE